MTHALLLARAGSQGLKGKNTRLMLGRPLMAYPLMAARGASLVSRCFVSSDSDAILDIGTQYGATPIRRPDWLCTSEALGEDAFVHGYRWIKEHVSPDVDIVVLLFGNAATITSKQIDLGVQTLIDHPEYDSDVTVSRDNMWAPPRARRIGDDGLLHPYLPEKELETMTCDRDSQGDVYFADMGVSIVRARCLDNLDAGLPPQRWMGRKIFPIPSWGGLDVDYEWQLPQVEFWLRKELGIEEPQAAAEPAASVERS